jgi:hypothetical protein
MKIDFDERLLSDGSYYITEKEASFICEANDPKKIHIPILPKYGWERRIRYDSSSYWIGKRIIDGSLIWCLREVE